MKKEANLDETSATQIANEEVTSVLAAYKSEGDPNVYENSYLELRKFVEESLDIYRYELSMILYPVLVHMYIELLYNGHEDQAAQLMAKFGPEQEYYYQDDLKKLAMVTRKDQISGNDLTETFKSNDFVIRISRDTLSLLKRHLHERKASVIMNIVNEHLYFDLYEGVARNRQQCDATAGSMMGEAKRQDNKVKVYYGLLKEPDLQTVQVTAPIEEDDDLDADDKPKKKKPKKDPLFSKKSKSDPNAPPIDRIPLPELRDVDKLEKLKALKEASKRVSLGPDSLPSVCFYTLMNSAYTVTCAEVSEDSSLVAIGFSDSLIKVFSLTPGKLRELKAADALKEIDRDADDILVRMMDDKKTAETTRTFTGHAGPVYRCNFAPDRTLMLSCSEDCTIRLWSLHTWTCLVVYKGHQYPVWDVRFSPHGHYFVSASHDRTARLWATDNHQPLRIFVGHLADVDCCIFHPNSNYVATGSSDRTVRLWDVVSGNHCRLMTGHKAQINTLCFSNCGKFLASGSADKRVLLWDLAHGHLIAALTGHSSSITSICFSRDGTVLTSASLDCSLKLWDFTKLCEDISGENINVSHNPDVKSGEPYLLRTFPTKASPIITLHFTRKNLLLAIGMLEYSQ